MNEQETIKAKIEQCLSDQKMLVEELSRLRGEQAKLKKPALSHGDYGYYEKCGNLWLVLLRNCTSATSSTISRAGIWRSLR